MVLFMIIRRSKILVYNYRSCDGRALIVCSTDGYCSIITFKPDELGVPVQSTEVTSVNTTPVTAEVPTEKKKVMSAPPVMLDEETEDLKLVLEDTIDNVQHVPAEKNPAISEIIIDNKVENIGDKELEFPKISSDKTSADPEIVIENKDNSSEASINPKLESPKVRSDMTSPMKGTGRRVQLITLSSPKKKKA